MPFAFLAAERGEPIAAIGTTTFRQPYKPVTFGAIAGQHVGGHGSCRAGVQPRCTAGTGRQNATFEPVGDWVRAPRSYPKDRRKFSRTRSSASPWRPAPNIGVLDASTLGKIDVRGKPIAREFLNRVYTNAWIETGAWASCRYGLMLGEDGMVTDDGVTACIADDHFHMTTTTGGAARRPWNAGGLSPDRMAGSRCLSDDRQPSNGPSQLDMRTGKPPDLMRDLL